MEIINSRIHTARKEYICDWCGSEIKIGEEYNKEIIADDGLREWKSHLECGEFASEYLFSEDDEANESDFCGCVNDMAYEMGYDTYQDTYELVKLLMEARG